MVRPNRVIIFVIIFLLPAAVWAGSYSGGYGRLTNPYRISTVADWQELIDSPNDWDEHFILVNDLDMQGVALTPVAPDMLDGSRFEGIPFTGIFDGRGHVIRNVVINQPASDNVGLFGCLNWPGEICNLGVEDVNITGQGRVGALVGFSEGGSIGNLQAGLFTACYATGRVSGVGVVGGLVGVMEAYGAITNCYAACEVSGGSYVGGLVGYNGRRIIECYAVGNVSGNRYVGGLVGFNYSNIIDSGAGGDVSGTEVVGGLIGYNDDEGSVSNCFWDMDIQTHGVIEGVGDNREYGMVTNLIGVTTAEMQTENTYSNRGWDFEETWTINEGSGYPQLIRDFAPIAEVGNYSGGDGSAGNPYRIGTVGGWQKLADSPNDWDRCFVLTNDIDPQGAALTPVATNSTFTGIFDGNDHVICNAIIDLKDDDYIGLFSIIGQGGQVFNLGVENVTVKGNHLVGGLVGMNFGTLTGCYSMSEVNGMMDVGGLVGHNQGGVISQCFTDGFVNGSSVVGGLVGDNYNGTITDCYAAGDVDGYGYVGGLVGSDANGTITSCFATGDISGNGAVGGLVGGSNTGSEITGCYYSGGEVMGSVGVGGLTGISLGSTIESCYTAAGYVDGNEYVGGFTGVNRTGSKISSSYSVADVNGMADVGGLAGYNDSNLFECFWDTEIQTYGITDSVGLNNDGNVVNVFALMTAEMMSGGSYTAYGWDFINTWGICEGENYPRLLWQKRLADLMCPDGVDMIDLALMANWWNSEDCSGQQNCDSADINEDGFVNLADMAMLADHWLEGI